VKILVLALVLSGGITLISADYEPPTAPPPFDNAPAPLHTGSGLQIKEGSLAVAGESGTSGFRVGEFFGERFTQSTFDFVADDVYVNADGKFFDDIFLYPMSHVDTATEHIACYDGSGRLSDCGDITGSAEDPQGPGLKVCMGRLEGGADSDVWMLNVMDSWTERDCNAHASLGFVGADRFALGCLGSNSLRRGNWTNITDIAGSPTIDCGWNSTILPPACTVTGGSADWCGSEDVGFSVSCSGGYTPFTYSWTTAVSHVTGNNSPAITPPSTVPNAVFGLGTTYTATVSETGSSTSISFAAPRRYFGAGVPSTYRVRPTVIATNDQGVSATYTHPGVEISGYLAGSTPYGSCPVF